MKRRMFAAWALGWLIYMIAMVMTVYAGPLSLIFQPICAAMVSGFCVLLCFLLGFVFEIPVLGSIWKATRWTPRILGLFSTLLLVFGSSFGLTEIYVDPDTGNSFVRLHSAVAFGSYFVLLFSIVNYRVSEDP